MLQHWPSHSAWHPSPGCGASWSLVLMTDKYSKEREHKPEYNWINDFCIKQGDYMHPVASSTKCDEFFRVIRNSIYCRQLASKTLSTQIFSSVLFKYRWVVFSKMAELFSSLLLIKYSQRSQMQHFIDDKYSQQENPPTKSCSDLLSIAKWLPRQQQPQFVCSVFCLFSHDLQGCLLLVIPGKKKKKKKQLAQQHWQ